jgi:hypothetical protein
MVILLFFGIEQIYRGLGIVDHSPVMVFGYSLQVGGKDSRQFSGGGELVVFPLVQVGLELSGNLLADLRVNVLFAGKLDQVCDYGPDQPRKILLSHFALAVI